MLPPVPDCLDLIPEPGLVHRRLGEAVRAERLLRRLLRLALAAQEEHERRGGTELRREVVHVGRR
jgi:hypothetical protein